MDCPTCKELERAFESRRRNYVAARLATYYRVCAELAAYERRMEHAKSDLEEHQLVCVFTASGPRASRFERYASGGRLKAFNYRRRVTCLRR